MAMPSLEFKVNKSGKPYTVYDIDKKKITGTINNREAYIFVGGEFDLNSIYFLGPNGTMVHSSIDTFSYPVPNEKDGKFWSSCLDYPYGTSTINGVNYKTFIMRKTMYVYKADGSVWGKVAAGRRVATNSDKVGNSHWTWLLINYVERTDGAWIKVDGAGYSHGFVDTGLTSASGYGAIALYGSW